MITSPDNEKLKLVRKLARKRERQREALFVTEGEDLLEAGIASGAQPRFVLTLPGSGIDGEEVQPQLLESVSALGSGTRAIAVWSENWSEPSAAPCLYLHAVRDPTNVGAIIRSVHALTEATAVLGPGCADPFSPKAVRATMGSIFGRPPARAGIDATPRPRIALVAHGGESLNSLGEAATLCLGAERAGLPSDVIARCDATVTIPLRPGGAESLNVAAAAAIVCERISSPALPGAGQ